MLADWRRSLAHLGRLLQACKTASGLVSTAAERRLFALECCGSRFAINIFTWCSEYYRADLDKVGQSAWTTSELHRFHSFCSR
eukprot:1311683-Amphidinium_carterae.1